MLIINQLATLQSVQTAVNRPNNFSLWVTSWRKARITE